MVRDNSIYSVITAPLVTEKSTRDSIHRKYVFWVNRDANKIEIKRAVETIYKVKVQQVSSLLVKGKTKRLRQNQSGLTATWKKAVVTLRKGFEIKLA